MNEEEKKREDYLLDEIAKLWYKLECHPDARVPVPCSGGNFFPFSTQSYYDDAKELASCSAELNQLHKRVHNKYLFDSTKLMSTLNDEVKIVENSKQSRPCVSKLMEKANRHLFEDLREVKELIDKRKE